MTALAFSGEVMDSRTLAASVNTNAVTVRRLLAALQRAGLVRTYAGVKGGAALIKKPTSVTLLEIYDAVEPRPIIAVNERKALKRCSVSCHMKGIMSAVAESTEQALRKHLRQIKLSNLVRMIQA